MATITDKADKATGHVTVTEFDRLEVRFAYDPIIVNKVKTLGGRSWHSGDRRWTADLTTANIMKLIDWGFSLDKKARAWREAHRPPRQLPVLDFGDLGVLDTYQKEGVQRAEAFRGRALFADDPGLGKTPQILTWLRLHPELRPVVIVTKFTGKLVWQRIAKRGILVDDHWIPLLPDDRVQVIDGVQHVKIDADVVIVNYDILANDQVDADGSFCYLKTKDEITVPCAMTAQIPYTGHVDFLKDLRPAVIVLDEPQQIRNRDSQRTIAVMRLAKHCAYLLSATASPIKKRPKEFFNILHLTRPDLFPNFWYFAQEFCLPETAPILMHDLSEKQIQNIAIGDKIIGWKRGQSKRDEKYGQRRLVEATVLNVLIKKAPLQEITLTDNSKLICTPDHKWLNGRSENNNTSSEYYCAKLGRFGGAGKGSASKIVRIFNDTSPLYLNKSDYKSGYLFGLFDGDGWCSISTVTTYQPLRGRNRPMVHEHRCGAATKDIECIDRAENYAKELGLHFNRRRRADGLHELHSGKKPESEFFKATKNTNAWWAGYLGGIYDAEGSGQIISQYLDVNPQTYARIQFALDKFNFKYTHSMRLGSPNGARIIGGRKEMMRFWKIASPSLIRKLKAYLFNGGGKFMLDRPYVKTIKPIKGVHDVYTLTTTTGNYVAYGCGSKNCGATHNGFGWDFNGATNTDKLYEILTEHLMIRRTTRDVMKGLPPPLRQVVPLNIKNRGEYDKADADFMKWLKSKGDTARLDRAGRAEALVRGSTLLRMAAERKTDAVVDWVKEFLESDPDKKLIAFTMHTALLNHVASKFSRISVKLDGSSSAKQRQDAEDRFQNDDTIRLFVGNSDAAGDTITLTAAYDVAFLELPKMPDDVRQNEGRAYARKNDPHSINSWFLVAAGTIEEERAEQLNIGARVVAHVLDGAAPDEDDDMIQLIQLHGQGGNK